ncbi:GNAT family N-acetyltransferase [Nocardioides humilatus]|uniref:GNAT family N-acetyltransferase n=1 Tax=Nocardioides humilatus TaxID=2607660 RepID=A0A5B1LLV4_9ACTN|nr:GNAT family N-acetyltransferase [Nocardioides humilatus]KAA1421513.1 GNAT family N-acetyltransferase [Nocardioides humilatus]
MTALVLPDVRWFPSWAATVVDFGDGVRHGSGDWNLPAPLEPTEESCAEFVAVLAAKSSADVESGRVASTYFWITAGDGGPDDEVIGFLNLRHELNDWLREEGGHIGYSVRPSHRRQGHAVRALALGVRRAGELGIDRVLVTCDTDNEPSARTIESGGGVFEDVRKDKRRYWIPVTEPAGP